MCWSHNSIGHCVTISQYELGLVEGIQGQLNWLGLQKIMRNYVSSIVEKYSPPKERWSFY